MVRLARWLPCLGDRLRELHDLHVFVIPHVLVAIGKDNDSLRIKSLDCSRIVRDKDNRTRVRP